MLPGEVTRTVKNPMLTRPIVALSLIVSRSIANAAGKMPKNILG